MEKTSKSNHPLIKKIRWEQNIVSGEIQQVDDKSKKYKD